MTFGEQRAGFWIRRTKLKIGCIKICKDQKRYLKRISNKSFDAGIHLTGHPIHNDAGEELQVIAIFNAGKVDHDAPAPIDVFFSTFRDARGVLVWELKQGRCLVGISRGHGEEEAEKREEKGSHVDRRTSDQIVDEEQELESRFYMISKALPLINNLFWLNR